MSDVAVRVENLGKRYRRGAPKGDDRLSEAAVNFGRAMVGVGRRLLASPRPVATGPRGDRAGEFWALQDVTFEINRGDVVGIIGRNGAGKSTLLKVLSRITEPTSGRFGLAGRVGSLLEVGTGFHAELTGRENVYLNGSLLGMSRAEVRAKFDEIVAFAEVDAFLDTPVKRYSSGMQMRLGFAVAAHLRPEILIIDEVLAVGDAQFQKKCLGKMGEVASDGRTVIFVSHNMVAVQSLCRQAVWLDGGRVRRLGLPREVVAEYTGGLGSGEMAKRWARTDAPGTNHVRLLGARISPATGDERPLTVRTPVRVGFEFWHDFGPAAVVNLSVVLDEVARGCVFNVISPIVAAPGGVVRGSFVIPADFLNDGTYTVRVLLVRDAAAVFDRADVLTFRIHDTDRTGWFGEWVGAVRPTFAWDIEMPTDGELVR